MNLEHLKERYGDPRPELEIIDSICDDFEREWLAGRPPGIEEHLNRIEQALRPALFSELLAVDLEYRYTKNLDDPDLEQLVLAYSDDAVLVGEIRGQIEARQTALSKAPPTRLIAHYELLEQVGAGGFGTVWRARDLKLDRTVAIKISSGYPVAAEDQDNFLHEARVAAQLQHPGIIRVHEAGRDGDRTYIVSDFVEGVNLGRWPCRVGLAAEDAARLCRKLAAALEHAHQKGIVHRDLTPGNIIIDPEGEPHITDFGLAKRLAHATHQSNAGRLLGTPAFMSPEQASGRARDVDGRSDIYSLGVVLYQLLTGHVPFDGDLTLVLQQIVNADPPPPRSQNSRIPRDLESICLKAISKSPAERYETAQEFADDLERFLHREPVAARPCGRLQRLGRQIRRHAFASGRFAFLALLVPAVGVVSWRSASNAPPASVKSATRAVKVTTVPAGARLAVVPIDEGTGKPNAQKLVRPSGKTPLTVNLEPAMYLVVADIPGYGFHEVHRTVPPLDEEEASEYFLSATWQKRPDGTIELPVINIPREADVTVALVPFHGGRFIMGDSNLPSLTPHSVEVADFFLAPTEVTIGEFLNEVGNLPNLYTEAGLPEGDRFPVTCVSFRQARNYAERVGLRLPTEEEFEFVATSAGTSKYPWGDDADRIGKWDYGPVGEPSFDRTPTEPPVFGLYSNVAEWTDSWSLPYAIPPQIKLPPQIFKMGRESPVVRGGPFAVVDRLGDERELQYGPRWRQGVMQDSQHRGLGFRCARSARPRFLN